MKRLFCIASAGVLAACASGPENARPELALPATFVSAPAPAPTGAPDPSDARWWQSFGDPVLDALVAAAVDGNRDLRRAVARLQEYEARAQSVGADRYPTLSYRAGGGRERMSEQRPIPLPLGTTPTNNQFEVGLQARWELDLWGRVRRADEAALADLLAVEEERRAVVMSLVADVTSGYAQLRRLDAELELHATLASLRAEKLRLLTLMAEGGSATELAVETARGEVARGQAAIAQLRRAVAASENALNQLAGRSPGPLARGRPLVELQPPGVPSGLPSDLLVRRPDLRRAEQQLVAAQARIAVARTQFLPTISLTGALGAASTSLSNLTLRSANTATLGAGLLGTLFDFGRIEGDVKAAEARRLQLAESYATTAGQALREVEDTLVALARNAEREAADQSRVESLRRLAVLQGRRLEGGSATALDTLGAELEVTQASLERMQSRHDGIALSVALFKAMGGGWIDLAAPPPQAAAQTSPPRP